MNAKRKGLYYPSFSLRDGDKCRWYHEKMTHRYAILAPWKLAPSLFTYTFVLIFFFLFLLLIIQLDNREPSKIDYIRIIFLLLLLFFLICSSVYYLRTIKWSYIAKFFLPKSLKYHLPRDHIIFCYLCLHLWWLRLYVY